TTLPVEPSSRSPANSARPSASVVATVSPATPALPETVVAYTATPDSATAFPNRSRSATTGGRARAAPAAAVSEGCVITPSRAGASGPGTIRGPVPVPPSASVATTASSTPAAVPTSKRTQTI